MRGHFLMFLQERITKAVEIGRVRTSHPFRHLLPSRRRFADRSALWLDSFDHLCWVHAEQPATISDQVRVLSTFINLFVCSFAFGRLVSPLA